MKKFSLIIFAITSLTFTNSCAKNETEIDNPKQVLILDDLRVLFMNNENNDESSNLNRGCPGITSADVFPINGCGTFKVKQTINYLIGSTTIESNITLCCVCAVCSPSFNARQNQEMQRSSEVMSIIIKESSSIIFENYEISIAEGEYPVDSNGSINHIKYNVIIN
jgi:hypothetical protein